MYEIQVVDVFQNAIYVAIVLLSVVTLPGLIVGLLVALVQALTQVNEMSLSFTPKLIVTLLVLATMAPWISNYMTNFTLSLFRELPYMVS